MTITTTTTPVTETGPASIPGRVFGPAYITGEDATALRSQVEHLSESLADAELAMDDVGWHRLSNTVDREFTRAGLRRNAALCRSMAVLHPLIRRGLGLRSAYVWGQGVQIAAAPAQDGEQDLNAVVQAFLDDESNQATFTSPAAREMNERTLGTDGNQIIALWTSPLTGRVQVRMLPFDEVDDVISNPADRSEPWFYRQKYSATEVGPETGSDGVVRTVTRTVERTVYYPALGYRPRLRPKVIDGAPVQWDAPVLHVKVNALDGWKFGIGDAYAAIFWARGYSNFLNDWAQLMRSLSKFAWRAAAKTGRGRQAARAAFAPGVVDAGTGRPTGDMAGAAAVTGPDTTLEAIPKSGATIDSGSGRPLAAMVAAALGVPVTMLLGDPGVTGARATAETLDMPTELEMSQRRSLHADVVRRIGGYVIDQAVKAPQGPLSGTVRVDPITGREVIDLPGGQDRNLTVDWPDLSQTAVDLLTQAIKTADDTGKMPPEVTARLLMQALGVDDVDDIIDDFRDGEGVFQPPAQAALLAQSQAAAQSALDAVRAGNVPTDDPAAAVPPVA